MKGILTTLFTLLIFLCSLSAQKPQPVQIQTNETGTYVVEYVPIATAQAGVDAQIVQVDKQLTVVEKQMADLLKKRDQLMTQKAVLELIDKQLEQAATTPPPPPTKSAEPETTPPPAKKPKKNKN